MSLCLCSVLADFRESGHCSQDSMREDSFVSSSGPDQFSENAVFSGSDSETQGPPTPSQEPVDQPLTSDLSDSEPPAASLDLQSSDETQDIQCPPVVCNNSPCELRSDTDVLSPVSEPVVEAEVTKDQKSSSNSVQEEKPMDSSVKDSSESAVHQGPRRSASVLSRKYSTDSVSVSM